MNFDTYFGDDCFSTAGERERCFSPYFLSEFPEKKAQEFRALIRGLLQYEQDDRLSSETVLQHKYFTEYRTQETTTLTPRSPRVDVKAFL